MGYLETRERRKLIWGQPSCPSSAPSPARSHRPLSSPPSRQGWKAATPPAQCAQHQPPAFVLIDPAANAASLPKPNQYSRRKPASSLNRHPSSCMRAAGGRRSHIRRFPRPARAGRTWPQSTRGRRRARSRKGAGRRLSRCKADGQRWAGGEERGEAWASGWGGREGWEGQRRDVGGRCDGQCQSEDEM